MYRKNLPTLIKESVRRYRFHSLLYGWTLTNVQGLAELGPAHPNYLTAAAPPPKRPPIKLCEICGYLGRYTCTRCGIAYCEISCQAIHDETRCERR